MTQLDQAPTLWGVACSRLITACSLVAVFGNAFAETHYVDANSTNPVAPFISWSTASPVIQDAINVAAPGDLVLVTNGFYATGGLRLGPYDVTNRVAITNSVAVQSVNGPGVTFIAGYQVPSGISPTNAIRCAYLSQGAALSGFTLTNGSAGIGNYINGGGVFCSTRSQIVSNCVITGNLALGAGGGAHGGLLVSCVLSANRGGGGGAAGHATLVNCVLTNNSAGWAGGILGCSATNCLVALNRATNYGGGSGFSTLVGCTVSSNSLQAGHGGTGGGSYKDTVLNCILYDNTAPSGSNYFQSAIAYSCTAPLSPGTGNLADPPLLVNQTAGNFRLQSNSPCINAGQNAYVGEILDLDRKARIVGGVVDAGAYEFQGNVRYVSLTSTNPVAPYSDWSIAATNIQDAVDAAQAEEMVLVTNGLYSTGERLVGSTKNRVVVHKPIHLHSVNGPTATVIQGYQVPGSMIGNDAVRCVYLTNGASLTGFTLTGGATRANGTTECSGGGLLCASTNTFATNCVFNLNIAGYGGGAVSSGTIENSLILSNSVIAGRNWGGGAFRSVLRNCTLEGNSAGYLGGGAYECTLTGCRLLANSAQSGGGSYRSSLTNCILAGNTAIGSNNQGGGARSGTLMSCLVISNSAASGGGVYASEMLNCTVVGNWATNTYGGAYSQETVRNCIVYYNSAPVEPNGSLGKFDYCCTTPTQSYTPHSFTNEPVFIDLANGNFRLQTNSPCINSGDNSYAAGSVDLDGRPRIIGGGVDIGAYEFQGAGAGEFIGWMESYGLPRNGSADLQDTDGDGIGNWGEWSAGTVPVDASSVLRLLHPQRSSDGIVIRWQSIAGGNYFLEKSTNLSAFSLMASNIAGLPGVTTYTDSEGTNQPAIFYRVGLPGPPYFSDPAFSAISFYWLQHYGLPTDGSADDMDADGDGMSNFKEWISETVPTNAASVFKLLSATNSGSGVVVTWLSATSMAYCIERTTNLSIPSSFVTLATNLWSYSATRSYTDTTATNSQAYFYRVRIQQ